MYTHYIAIKRDHQGFRTDRIAADVQKLWLKCEIPLADGWGHPGSRPTITHKSIEFNGVGPDSHEPFYYPPTGEDIESASPPHHPVEEYGYFCKTAEKTYDLMVAATMLAIKHHLDDDVRISSDSCYEDAAWEKARNLYQDTFPEREIPDPELGRREHRQKSAAA